MGLSGPTAAGDMVAQLAPDDPLDGHGDQWGHPVARVAVAGLYRGHDRAAPAAPAANVTGRRAIPLTAGGRRSLYLVSRAAGRLIYDSRTF